MTRPHLALSLLATGCFAHPIPPAPPVPAAPAFTCNAPAAPVAPAVESTAARSLEVALVSGEAPDWSAPTPVAAPAAAPATPAWGAAPAAPAAAPVWGATAAVAAPAAAPGAAWGGPAPAPPPAAPAAGAAWGGTAAPPAQPDAAAGQAWFRSQAEGLVLSIQADGAPLGSAALAVGAALSLPVVVQPELAGRSLTLADGAISLADLGRVLREVHGAALSFEDGTLMVSDLDAFVERNYQTEPAPLETLILPSPDGVPAAHVAATWCALAATDRGTASVVGGAVTFRDDPAALDAARGLVEELSATATALWADDTATDTP